MARAFVRIGFAIPDWHQDDLRSLQSQSPGWVGVLRIQQIINPNRSEVRFEKRGSLCLESIHPRFFPGQIDLAVPSGELTLSINENGRVVDSNSVSFQKAGDYISILPLCQFPS